MIHGKSCTCFRCKPAKPTVERNRKIAKTMIGNRRGANIAWTPELRAQVSNSVRKAWANPKSKYHTLESRELRRKIMQEVVKRKDFIEKISKASIKMWRSAEYRAKVIAAHHANSYGPYLETTLEKAVVNWARRQGMLVFKMDPKFCAGVPDRMFLIPGGIPFFIEFKRVDGRGALKKLQRHIIKKMQGANYDVEVHSNKRAAIAAIRERALAAAQVPRKGNKVSH